MMLDRGQNSSFGTTFPREKIMSNEYKEYMKDKAQEILLNAHKLDKITEVMASSQWFYVLGLKNNKEAVFRVWMNNDSTWEDKLIFREE
jgi:hypothetical protein